jgi:hypothetical protein
VDEGVSGSIRFLDAVALTEHVLDAKLRLDPVGAAVVEQTPDDYKVGLSDNEGQMFASLP